MRLVRNGLLKFVVATLLFSAFVVAWLGFGEHGFIHLYRMEKERRGYIERIRKLEAENRALLDEIDRLLHDSDYMESLARRELGFIKRNEVLYRYTQEEDEAVFSDRLEDGG